MAIGIETTSSQAIRLYRELADWYPLLTPVGDYAEDAAFGRRMFEAHCQRPPRTLLDLGKWSPSSTVPTAIPDLRYSSGCDLSPTERPDMTGPPPPFWQILFEVFESLPPGREMAFCLWACGR